MAITPEFLFRTEYGLQVVANQEYQRLLPKVNEIWQLAKRINSVHERERLVWAIDTATIVETDKQHGGVRFEELGTHTTEYEPTGAGKGFEMRVTKLEDLDNNGVQGGEGLRMATAWVRQITAQSTYWPRKQVLAAIRNGDQTGYTTYDGKKFFDTAHPVNPVNSEVTATFNNVFTGAASGAYPGACPIDSTNAATLDVAMENLNKVRAYIEGAILMPNGQDPRMLRVAGIWAPPALQSRVQQLTNAKFIAQAAATGGGSGDVEYVVNNWGYGQPVIAPELGAAFTNGSDTSYYVVAEQLASDVLGAITYVEREPFQIVYNTGMTDAQLRRASTLQWTTKGRNVVGYGHPYLLFKVKAT